MSIQKCEPKDQNISLVIKSIITEEAITRIDIARVTGLSKMTISNIVSVLIRGGVIEETTDTPAHYKTNMPVVLDISKDSPCILGLNIRRDCCSAVVCDLKLNPCAQKQLPIPRGCTAKMLETMIYELIDSVLTCSRRIFAIGIGSIGPVDITKGIVIDPPNFYGIRNFPIKDIVARRLNLPVSFNSWHNCSILREKYFGLARTIQNAMYVGITNGIGAGVMLADNLYSDYTGNTVALGHLSIDQHGEKCACGNRGCLELYTSSISMRNTLRRLTGEDLSFREFCLKSNDEVVANALKQMAVKLGFGLANCVNLLAVDLVILGDDGVFLPDEIVQMIEDYVNTHALNRSVKPIQVKKSLFTDSKTANNCAMSVHHRIFTGTWPTKMIWS